jgi:hypothetical protein
MIFYHAQNPLTSGVGVWGAGMVGTGMYVYRQKVPLSLKVIQARMVAQAGVVSAICVAGMVTFLTSDAEPHKAATSSWQVREFNKDGSAKKKSE